MNFKNFLLDLIFPRFCLGCQKELDQKTTLFICKVCLNNIILNGIQCHICGLRNNNGTCRHCFKKTFLSGLFAAGKYENPTLREAIHTFKYNSIESLKKPLAELVIKYLKKENLLEKLPLLEVLEARFPTLAVLTPIPLTWRRKLSRGFNQSELLAMEISKYLNLPIANLLKRKKFNTPQAKIQDWGKRKENISGAFVINPSAFHSSISHLSTPFPLFTRCRTSDKVGEIKRVVLVDDVSTSGATLEEAAKVLKNAGIKEVYGLVVAKG